MNDSLKEAFWKHSLKMRKWWYPAFFPFFTIFSTPLRDQSHSLIHILFVLCRRLRLMSLKFYCLVIHISHKMLEIGCAWSKGSGERLQGHHGPLVCIFIGWNYAQQCLKQNIFHVQLFSSRRSAAYESNVALSNHFDKYIGCSYCNHWTIWKRPLFESF